MSDVLQPRDFMVRQGQRVSEAEWNAFRKHVLRLGISDAGELSRTVLPTGSTLAMPSHLHGPYTETYGGGWRVPCLNMDPRAIPEYSVVQLYEVFVCKSAYTDPTPDVIGSWPDNPAVAVRRSKKGGGGANIGWVDQTIPAEGQGTVVLGGLWVVWIHVGDCFAGATWNGLHANYLTGMRFAQTQQKSYRLWSGVMGEFAVIWRRYFETEPDWGWHPETTQFDATVGLRDKYMALVKYAQVWG